MSSIQEQDPPAARTRRRHKKSRNGCLECKRRRVKCDEKKPACTRCVLELDKCVYTPAPVVTRPPANHNIDRHNECSVSVMSASESTRRYSTNAPIASTYSGNALSFDSPPHTSPASSEALLSPSAAGDVPGSGRSPSDTDLYHHYLQHTCRTLSDGAMRQRALQIGMPTLALKSKTVYHSILAAAAACMACDMISGESPAQPHEVYKVSLVGYRHYNAATILMRQSISLPGVSKMEPLLASTIMLVPFATASQLINHWISSRSEPSDCPKLLATTPMDVIVIMRGVQTTLQSLDHSSSSPNTGLSPGTEAMIEGDSPLADIDDKPPALAASRRHVMFPIIAATCHGAFAKLQNHLESAAVMHHDSPDESITACSAAFEILQHIMNNTFPIAASSSPKPPEHSLDADIDSIPHIAPWLQCLASKTGVPHPTESLTRFFLTFLVQMPQVYLDLVLPLLDQRLAAPLPEPLERCPSELNCAQVLALDIYAHWSVLMFLVEHESWWIGNLPVLTLSGLVNRFGETFVGQLWPEAGTEQERWWPGSMLRIMIEIKRYQ